MYKGLISIAITAFNEGPILNVLYQRLVKTLDETGHPFEIVIVDNGSTDDTCQILQELNDSDGRLKFIRLSRNFGHQGGLLAALDHSRGDAVISMDADLQHPPEVIPRLIERWRQGFNVVLTTKSEKNQNLFRRGINNAFYGLLSKLSGFDMRGGHSDFRLMDRNALDALLALREKNKFLRGLVKWIGFRQTSITYDVAPRYSGTSKFRFIHLWKLALDGILSFTTIPIHVFTVFGLIVSFFSLSYVGVVVIIWVGELLFGGLGYLLPPGWVSLAAGVFFLGGVQLIGIGLLGEYLGRVFDETKGRPAYLVQEMSPGLGEDAPDPGKERR